MVPNSHFAQVPASMNMPRSKFDFTHRKLGTFNSGQLVPIAFYDVLPGDTLSVDVGSFVRMSTPLKPVLDNCYLDTFAFFIPYRLTWEHWKQFMGEPESDFFSDSPEYVVPHLKGGKPLLVSDDDNIVNQWNNYVPFNCCLDSLGVPAGTTIESCSALPFRANALVWNEYFRSQELQSPADVDLSDSDGIMYTPAESNATVDANGTYSGEYWIDTLQRGGPYPPVDKYFDYFTSALPTPSRGPAVPIPLSGFSPVYSVAPLNVYDSVDWRPTHFADQSGNILSGNDFSLGIATNANLGIGSSSGAHSQPASPANLIADLNLNKALSDLLGVQYSTINDLRYANAMQSLLDADNRYGTRYREILRGHFAVSAPEGELQVPEYLGGRSALINMNQVLQTSASTPDGTPQGNTAAYSVTSDQGDLFTKSFCEHGIVIFYASVRYKHTYQQGLNRYWSKRTRYDFYWPELAMIPDQPIYNYEIYNSDQTVDGDGDPSASRDWTVNNEIFGYNEAWSEYRYKPDETFGQFRSGYPNGSLDVWHYGDFYTSQPTLSYDWISEDPNNLERTLADNSASIPQFLAEFSFKTRFVRPVPMHSYGAMDARF